MVRGGALHSRPPAGLPKRQRPQVHEKGLVPRRDHGPCHGRFYSICRALCLILAGVAATCVTSVTKGEGDPAQLWGSDRGPVGRRPARDAAYRHVTGRELSYLCVFIVSTCTYTARRTTVVTRSLSTQVPPVTVTLLSVLMSVLQLLYDPQCVARADCGVCRASRVCGCVRSRGPHAPHCAHSTASSHLRNICVKRCDERERLPNQERSHLRE